MIVIATAFIPVSPLSVSTMVYVGKQPVAWKEYCAEYCLTHCHTMTTFDTLKEKAS